MPTDGRARYIAFQVGLSLYGLSVDEVQEVVGMRPLTRVFHAPPALGGVTNLRGDVLPVLDLPVILGEPRTGGTLSTQRILVVREREGERRCAGLKVDGLAGLREPPAPGLAPLPLTVSTPVSEVALGLIPDPPVCVVLSASRVLGCSALAELRGTAPGIQ
jgi:purine-binding chemotaxis protein CheW